MASDDGRGSGTRLFSRPQVGVGPLGRRAARGDSGAPARAIAGPAAAARATAWAGRAMGVLGRAPRPLRSARRALSSVGAAPGGAAGARVRGRGDWGVAEKSTG